MILDANILLYAVDRSSPHHEVARPWLESALSGDARVGFPVQTLTAFIRIVTHPRVMRHPLTPQEAAAVVDDWLGASVAWVPPVGAATWRIANSLIADARVTGNLVPDAVLAASAMENSVPLVSADTDFARFDELTWLNPLRR